MKSSLHLALIALAFAGVAPPWPTEGGLETLEERFPPPPGFERLEAPAGSFTAWLRELPLKEVGAPVLLYDGARKRNQGVHAAVLDIDVGGRDLQQCADAVIRLRAEYLRAANCSDSIAFDFTSGDLASWKAWRQGQRPKVEGNRVSWSRSAGADSSYDSFRSYLRTVFTYAGSASLSRELEKVADVTRIEAGDVWIRGGFPGHAVLVVDVSVRQDGERRFLLAQSYMPAQDVHLLKAPSSDSSPWYSPPRTESFETPEWTFDADELRRFPNPDCRSDSSIDSEPR